MVDLRLLALDLPWCTSRASWRQGRSWWVRLWKRRARAPGWCRCSLQAPRWSGGPGWGDHHHQDDHNRHHRHHRLYHHHLVARHVVMHQVRGIGMMQYITKMMKTKYLGGLVLWSKWFKSSDFQSNVRRVFWVSVLFDYYGKTMTVIPNHGVHVHLIIIVHLLLIL